MVKFTLLQGSVQESREIRMPDNVAIFHENDFSRKYLENTVNVYHMKNPP